MNVPPARRSDAVFERRRSGVVVPQRRFTDLPLVKALRPHPLMGIVTVPDDARGLVLVCSSGTARETAAVIAGIEQDPEGPGLAVALFDDLLPSLTRSDPLTIFDVRVIAARLLTAIDLLTERPDTGALALGCLGLGGGSAAAVIAASERPELVRALVLKGSLVAASTSLPSLVAPSLYLRPRGLLDDCGFLTTAPGKTREVRTLAAGASRSGAQSMLASHHARRWFERHLMSGH